MAKKEFSLAIYKKIVDPSDLELIYNEMVQLEKEIIRRERQSGGSERPQELYLESGRIKTVKAKMRYVQAILDNKYPNDLLEIYKGMNFKIVGHGKYPDLKNWKEIAKDEGIVI